MKLAKNLENLGTESAFSVLAEAKALEAKGNPMIHLGLGQPDFKTPKHVVEAAKKAKEYGATGLMMLPPMRYKADSRETVNYFKKVFPEMDFERVYPSDQKKMVKWFEALKKHNVEIKLSEVPEEETEEPVQEEAATIEKPLKKKK